MYISTYKILFPVVKPPGKSDSIFCSTASVSVHRTRSLEAELYYVREGVVNAYAMSFVVPVPANIADLEFSWQSLAGIPPWRWFSFGVEVGDGASAAPDYVTVVKETKRSGNASVNRDRTILPCFLVSSSLSSLLLLFPQIPLFHLYTFTRALILIPFIFSQPQRPLSPS
ncbi:hypothetical protein KQX54_008555 [Cotesia glomerata]|uniref:WIF domain-containing protein n=1 Tax=Cotesia glomerata TaxID=32391 RepID=A0AAV7J6F3_COTGL|nr:hypothetical protein KQX54_008555 [Cotesia glomerata]